MMQKRNNPPPSRADPFVSIESFKMRLVTVILEALVIVSLVAFVLVVVTR